jgi:anti-sigma28 factor (negative regulator of flagellin synthesis)
MTEKSNEVINKMLMELQINPEFHNIIPSISSDEYQLLEQSILQEGCREAIITWNGSIIDGYNRYEICHKHNIGFKILEKEFDSEEEAKIWIIKNQLARRNLPPHERARLALLLKPVIEEKAEKRMKVGKADPTQKSAEGETREEIARIAGVSHDTIRKSEIIEKEATEEIKQAVRKGEMSVNKAFKATRNPKPKKPIIQTKPLAIEKVNDEIKKTFEAFYEAVRRARKNQWKDTPKQAIKQLLENLEGLLI